MSRRLVAAVALVLVACQAGGGVRPLPADEAIATLVRVEDGDSLVVTIDGVEERVRLVGINAPERDECGGEEAKALLVELVGEGPLLLEPGLERRDRYGRLLAYVFAAGTLTNEAQVAAGLAVALTSTDRYTARIAAAESAAIDAGLGLWSPDACGGGPRPDVSIVTVEWDPPGPDDEVLDEEYVVIRAGEPVDLSGWVLRDESTINRFVFPAGTVLGPGEHLVVVSGCRPPPGDLGWCSDRAVWNNTGDTAFLLDPSGRIIDRFRYEGR